MTSEQSIANMEEFGHYISLKAELLHLFTEDLICFCSKGQNGQIQTTLMHLETH